MSWNAITVRSLLVAHVRLAWFRGSMGDPHDYLVTNGYHLGVVMPADAAEGEQLRRRLQVTTAQQ